MKNGFTLVELSIVLVIVGLLIGGILVGQSLIESAKLNRVISQLSQYDVAVTTFYTKYKQLPGDSNLFDTTWGWAYNNDKVTDGSCYECGRAWRHLSAGIGLKNIYGSNYVNFDPFNTVLSPITQSSCPKLVAIDQNTAATTPCLIIYYPVWAPGVGYYRYDADPPSLAQTQGVLSPKVVMALDSKMDDGKTTGKITATGASCVSGTNYLISDSYSCRGVTIRTGIATGFEK